MLSFKSVVLAPLLVLLSVMMLGGSAHATPSSFNSSSLAPGNDKTYNVSIPAQDPPVGALTIPATGAVVMIVDGVMSTPDYTVTKQWLEQAHRDAN
jgi:hypothetical protein